MTAMLLPRPGILDIAPYVGGESAVAGVERIIKLASNESALGPSPRALAALREGGEAIHRYPDGGCAELRRQIGRIHGLDAGRIVCGAGSDELIGLLCRAYAGPGDTVVYTRHGFLMYPIAAQAAGATPLAVAERNLTADVDAILAGVSETTRIVFLANPNNPTGTFVPAAEMARLRAGLRRDVLLVIDAAYAEYIAQADYTCGFDLVDAGDNVVVTRTFSKIYGLGGLRLGWAYCPPEIADVLNRSRNPFNVSSLAQAAGVAALADGAFVQRAQEHNAYWRAWLRDALLGLGLDVGESFANFVLARFPDPDAVDAADAFLKRRGIIVRRMAAYRLPDALRITIGREDELRELVAALEDHLARR
ncbi:MAG: histidinol-phosphate transaminase [Rhodospirillales bacterium]|nr:histidinol-phosphate transaminase [Rhodospirillales bacterium]